MSSEAEIKAAAIALCCGNKGCTTPSKCAAMDEDWPFADDARLALAAAEQVRDSASGITTLTFSDPPRPPICGND